MDYLNEASNRQTFSAKVEKGVLDILTNLILKLVNG
jgi:hypothetical protein